MPKNVWLMDVLDSVMVALFRRVVFSGELAPSLRAVAAEAGMSPAGIIQHLGSRHDMLGRAAHRWTEQRRGDLIMLRGSSTLAYLLPEQEPGVDDLAFDFALVAMARGHEGIAVAMSGLRHAERERLATICPQLGKEDLDVLVAVLDGLRFAMSLPFDALPLERARSVLTRVISWLADEAV